ncbi:MAG: hypothetical protein AAAB11_20515 [Rhizobium giardinii]
MPKDVSSQKERVNGIPRRLGRLTDRGAKMMIGSRQPHQAEKPVQHPFPNILVPIRERQKSRMIFGSLAVHDEATLEMR